MFLGAMCLTFKILLTCFINKREDLNLAKSTTFSFGEFVSSACIYDNRIVKVS